MIMATVIAGIITEKGDLYKMKNLLFVCEGNEQRSPSFVLWFKEHRSEYNVRSAGTHSVYFVQINKELLEWADRVFLMDLEQEVFLMREFPEFIFKCEIIGCSDQYQRESFELNRLIEYWVCKRGL